MPSPTRRVLRLALPLILSNLTQPVLSSVDTVLSGHLPGAAALGGVALGGIFFNAIFWTFGFLRMSTSGLVAQAHGAGDVDQLHLHRARALLIALGIGSLLLLAERPLIAIALQLLGASGAVLAAATTYCTIRIWAAPAALGNYAILGTLLGRQHARQALLLQAAINAVNITVALALVMGLGWGIKGIAMATLCADVTGFALGLLLLFAEDRKEGRTQLPLSQLLDLASLRKLFALNLDIFLRTLSLVAAYAWFTRTGARSGELVLAANALLMNLHMMASYALDGFANATEALVGAAVGRGDLREFDTIVRASTRLAIAVAAAISLIFAVGGHTILGWFSSDAAVCQLAGHFLPFAAVLPVVSVYGFQMDGLFIGATRARDLRNSMLLSVAVYLPLAIVLSRPLGNAGLWVAFLLFMALRGLTLGMHLPAVRRTLAMNPVSSTKERG